MTKQLVYNDAAKEKIAEIVHTLIVFNVTNPLLYQLEPAVFGAVSSLARCFGISTAYLTAVNERLHGLKNIEELEPILSKAADKYEEALQMFENRDK